MTGVSKITLFGLFYFLPQVDAEGRSKQRGREWRKKRSCDVCKSVNYTSHFKKKNNKETFDMLKGSLDCNSSIIYLFECLNVHIAFLMWVALKLSLGTE